MVSLFFRNLLFTILQPGIVAGLIPFLILGSKVKNTFDQPFKFYHSLGATVFIIGFVIMLICIISFAVQGQGTLSPADPTKKLDPYWKTRRKKVSSSRELRRLPATVAS